MSDNKVYDLINERIASGKKSLAVLLDPDKVNSEQLADQLSLYKNLGVNFIFIGGSLLVTDDFHETIKKVKSLTNIPVVLFPGNAMQVSKEADAILFLSLISGRNADLLIGQHVVSAPSIKKAEIECISTGYMLINCGNQTTAHYMSQTAPIPFDKPQVASCTAMAGEMLGLKMLYLDGGSGAQYPVSTQMIEAVKSNANIPLIVGGGLKSSEDIDSAFKAGADLVVVGTSIEKDEAVIEELFQSEFLGY